MKGMLTLFCDAKLPSQAEKLYSYRKKSLERSANYINCTAIYITCNVVYVTHTAI